MDLRSYPTYLFNTPDASDAIPLGMLFTIMRREIPTPVRSGYAFASWYADAACTQPVTPDPNGTETYYAGWTPWTDAERRSAEEYSAAMQEIKYLVARPKAFTWESFAPFFRAANRLIFDYESNLRPLDAEAAQLMDELAQAKAALVPVADPEESAWYIWGEQMPQAANAGSYDYYYKFDYPGFRPFLVPYLLPDQTSVKGNLIVIAGGGYSQRYNQSEGYCIAQGFNDLGYNAFVLQRRVEPSEKEDAFLDLQRSVRYLKYHAAAYGIGAMEHIATVGFSGGGMTITGQLERCYGDRSPSLIYPDYLPDEIDAINADYEVAMPIYGGFAPENTDNPHLPAIFAVVGARDYLMLGGHSENAFLNLLHRFPDIDMELHIFAGAGHGFGPGYGTGPENLGDCQGYIGADNWMRLADDFMQVRFGLIPRTYLMGQRPTSDPVGA